MFCNNCNELRKMLNLRSSPKGERYLRAYQLIQSEPVTFSQIASHIGVSTRTARRYATELRMEHSEIVFHQETPNRPHVFTIKDN